ncbi:MAG: methionyl-tRNA formyltransferase [Desulfovibrio sp.]|nr:methionyl-tRNA formyltransferase [Desulfovibrio sp.]
MGTPAFAVSILEKIADGAPGTLIACYCQPDTPANRGHKVLPPPAALWAKAHGIPVYQPQTLKTDDCYAQLQALKPDFLVVAAYGKIIPERILKLPTYPPLNVHGSLLPFYRGAAPIQRAILEHGEEGAKTGVSIMEMVAELDAGSVFAQEEIPIANATADELFVTVAEKGGALLCAVMKDLLEGKAKALAQDHSRATYAAKLEKSDGHIQWYDSAQAVHARIRAVTSKPGAHTTLSFPDGATIPIVFEPGCIGEPTTASPATLARKNDLLMIACLDRWYCLGRIKPQGKKYMDVAAFINGYIQKHSSDCKEGFVGTVF